MFCGDLRYICSAPFTHTRMKKFVFFLYSLFVTASVWAQLSPVKDSTGKYIYAYPAYRFNVAHPFSQEGFAVVKDGERWHIIDEKLTQRSPSADSIDVTYNSGYGNYYHIYLLKGIRGWYLYNIHNRATSKPFVSILQKLPYQGKLLVEMPSHLQALLDIGDLYLSTPFDSLVKKPSPSDDGHFFVKYDRQFHLTDAMGESIAIYEYMDFLENYYANNFYFYRQNGLWNARRGNRKAQPGGVPEEDFFVIPEMDLCLFRKGSNVRLVNSYSRSQVSRKSLTTDTHWIGDDPQGLWNLNLEVDSSLILFRREKFGFMDKNLNTIIPAIYDSAFAFAGRTHTAAKKDGQWCILDRNGNITPSQIQSEWLEPVFENYFITRLQHKYGIITADGQTILPLEYRLMKDLGQGWIFYQMTDSISGIYDLTTQKKLFEGNYPLPLQRLGSNALYHYTHYQKMLISPKGEILFSGDEHASIHEVGEGHVSIHYWDKPNNALIDRIYDPHTQTLFPASYRRIGRYSEGFLPVSLDNKTFFYIDHLGNPAFPQQQYTYAESFWNGKAKVQQNGKIFYINHNGQPIGHKKGR